MFVTCRYDKVCGSPENCSRCPEMIKTLQGTVRLAQGYIQDIKTRMAPGYVPLKEQAEKRRTT